MLFQLGGWQESRGNLNVNYLEFNLPPDQNLSLSFQLKYVTVKYACPPVQLKQAHQNLNPVVYVE